MENRESKFVLPDVCPMCGGPKPCVLHDRKFKEALLAPEEETIADLFETREIGKHEKAVMKLTLLSENSFIAGLFGKNGQLFLYSGHGDTWSAQELPSCGDYIAGVAFFSPGSFIADLPHNQNHLYSLKEGVWSKQELFGRGGYGEILRVHPLSGNRFIGQGTDTTFECTLEGNRWYLTEVEQRHGEKNRTIAVLSENRFVVAREDGKIALYSLQGSGWSRHEIENYGDDIYRMAALSEDSFVVGGFRGGKVTLYSLQGSEWARRELESCGEFFSGFAALTENRFVVGGDDGIIFLYCLEGGKWSRYELENFGNKVENILRLSEGSFVVGGIGGKVKLYEIPDAENATHAFHERQLAKTDEPVPELPEV